MSDKRLHFNAFPPKIKRPEPVVEHRPGLTETMMRHRMAKKPIPSPDDLRKILDYDPVTGILTWKPRSVEMFKAGRPTAEHARAWWNARYAGKQAGAISLGYLKVSVFDLRIQAHRVCWAIHYGEWPEGQIDHINGDRTDNRIANLRVVTNAENMRNKKRPANNISGVVGVYWEALANRWRAGIGVDGAWHSLGVFTSFDEACAARAAAELKLGFHPNHGRADRDSAPVRNVAPEDATWRSIGEAARAVVERTARLVAGGDDAA